MKQFAKKKLLSWLQILLHTHDSPERTSLAFAVGVFIACLPPVPWFHTLFAIVVAFTFRLNRVATLLGAYINTPLTLLPLLALETTLGLALLGGGKAPHFAWHQFETLQGWRDAGVAMRPMIAPMLLGSFLTGAACSAVAYAVSLLVIRAYRRRGIHAKAGETAVPSPSVDGHTTSPVEPAQTSIRTKGGEEGPAPGGPGARGWLDRAVDTPENPS